MEALPLLSKEFLTKLDQLTILSRRIHRSGVRGRTPTYRKGSSLEFREYRPYHSGDDVRFVDWNVYGRLEKLLTKVFTAEEDRTLYLLIDSSGSMGVGEPSKLRFAAETAAALAYISARNQDRVGIFSLGSDIKSYRRPMKGSGALLDSFGFLESLEPQGSTDLSAACNRFLSGTERSGVAVILTDLLDSGDYREGLRRLLYRRFEVVLIHTLAAADLAPQVDGPLLLQDRESGATAKITVDKTILSAYRRNLDEFLSGAEDFCRANGVEYVRTASSAPLEDFILNYIGSREARQ